MNNINQNPYDKALAAALVNDVSTIKKGDIIYASKKTKTMFGLKGRMLEALSRLYLNNPTITGLGEVLSELGIEGYAKEEYLNGLKCLSVYFQSKSVKQKKEPTKIASLVIDDSCDIESFLMQKPIDTKTLVNNREYINKLYEGNDSVTTKKTSSSSKKNTKTTKKTTRKAK